MRLFYDPNIETGALMHTLSEEESKHIVRVLRMNNNDKLGILDGRGTLYIGEIAEANAKRCVVNIVGTEIETDSSNDIHIAIAPTKQNERIEWFIEKATEIGITEITLIQCKNSERVKSNTDRLIKKAVSAMKQSHRKSLPKINELVDFTSFVKSNPNGLIAHCYEGPKHQISEVFNPMKCPVLIGPEGDFTLEEVKLAEENGYKTITLGENRLRTETAALYACMQLKLIIDRKR